MSQEKQPIKRQYKFIDYNYRNLFASLNSLNHDVATDIGYFISYNLYAEAGIVYELIMMTQLFTYVFNCTTSIS